ncbi:hypothetical protein BGX28_009520 [Mortierella sp. GBA30]|nr:hypothetical protein BGX28_009520 [Mortierella sp. GBA30]
MTPLPYKIDNLAPSLTTPSILSDKLDEKTRLRQYEFPVSVKGGDVKANPSNYQSYPFTQHQQPHQAKAHQTYVSKYSSYTNSSQTRVRVSTGTYQKPSTTSALSLIEKEKMAFPYRSHRDSIISPPPPPYLHSDQGVPTPSLDPSLSDSVPTSASLTRTSKRNSLPVSAASPNSPIAAARTARELKRHSLPVSHSPMAGLQWPSAMTMTMAAVTRPKLARTMPPQAIAIPYASELRNPSPLSAVTPTAVFTPRSASRLSDRTECETLYNIRSNAALPSATSARIRSMNLAKLQHSRAGSSFHRNSRGPFPSFWQDAKEHHIQWTFYSFGAMAVGCLVSVAIMPALVAWVALFPIVVTLMLGAHYGGYRWRRHKYSKQQLKDRQLSPTAVSSMRAASAALTHSRASSMAPFANNNAATHSQQASRSSMHTSVGSIGSDSFLEPHHPSHPHNLKSQFQHQYYRSSASMSQQQHSPPSPLRRFAEGYCPHGDSHPQSPSPEYRQSWLGQHSQQSQKSLSNSNNRLPRVMERQNSSSSVASSETVSSTSTASETQPQLDASKGSHVSPALKPQVDMKLDPSLAPLSPSSPLESSMMPPPPAYVSRKCEEMVMKTEKVEHGTGEEVVHESTLSEKARLSVALPEIAPMGDLASEFAFDFGALQF